MVDSIILVYYVGGVRLEDPWKGGGIMGSLGSLGSQ